ncbi:hypothetical protein ABZ805_05450 [Saccharopolyspora sp. NPDC047091]|uniref:hypothetical protein n=1 Tax=Saccharopolyspora sp. NPDC047091 TaxID=3155924 RepID=UPI0033FE371D
MKFEARTLTGLVGLGGVLAGSVLVPAPVAAAEPAAPAACEIRELPLPPGATRGGVGGASPDGRTAVGRAVREGPTQVETDVVWRDGEIATTYSDLPDSLTAVNSAGVAVGGIFDDYGDRRPYVLRDGEVHVLPGHVTPRGINDSGKIAGFRTDGAGEVPVVWEPGSDEPVDLAGPRGIATGISADGTVVGTVDGDTPDAPTNGYVWRPDGTSAPLPRPAGVAPNAHLEATGISGPWVFGGGPDGAIRWNLDTGAAESIPDTFGAGAINEQGVLAAPTHDSWEAVLVDGEQRTPLPGMNGWQLAVSSISPDATVLTGAAGMLKGPSKPVRWTCS